MSLNAAAELLCAAESVAVIAHVTPDGDTLGSALALALALEKLGIGADVCCGDGVPHLYRFLPSSDRVRMSPGAPRAVAVAVDVSDPARLGGFGNLFVKSGRRIVLDHHATNTGFGDIDVILPRASTAQIVLELIDLMGVLPNADIARCLYVGLATDTGNFVYANTDGEALRCAARLADCGIDISAITKLVYRTRRVAKTRLIGRAIERMEFLLDGRLAVISLTPEDYRRCGADDADTEGIINYAAECEGVQVAALARESAEGIKISLRSNGNIDVGELAKSLGGGGHRAASGVTLSGPMPGALERVFLAVRQADKA